MYRQPELHQQFSAINELIFAEAEAGRIQAGFRSAFKDCAELEPAHRLLATTDVELLNRLNPVLIRLREDEANPLLEELAEIAGMGKYQLIRAMKRMTGLAPLAWRTNERVTASRRMLRAGAPLAETAHALGFVDQSHFHRVFRAHVAATPGRYRS